LCQFNCLGLGESITDPRHDSPPNASLDSAEHFPGLRVKHCRASRSHFEEVTDVHPTTH
jgi:hypothetical protein